MSIEACYVLPHPPLIIPEVGRGQEKEISETVRAYERIAGEIAAKKPDTIVFVTPHSMMYVDYFHISPSCTAQGNFASYRAGNVELEVEYDAEFVDALCHEAEKTGISAGTLGEKIAALDHGVMVPLFFLRKFDFDFKAVRISISGQDYLSHYKLGEMISSVSDKTGKKTVFIASGDLSHKLTQDGPYGFSMEGPMFDSQITEIFKTAAFDKLINLSEDFAEAAAECGLKGFFVMAGALNKKSVKQELVSYEGPFGVGYAVASFEVTGEDSQRDFYAKILKTQIDLLADKITTEDSYVSFARYAVEGYIRNERVPELPEGLPEEMLNSTAGVFVSIKKMNNLRGCVGTISPLRENIAYEILSNAISSAVGDSRFLPVTEDELPFLSYSVDVLKKLEPVYSLDKLDVKKYGIVVRNKFKKGLLLPNLDGVDTVEKQIEISKQKAGIKPDEDFSIERFEVIRHT
ncbi:MAG: AmmeMemoRadiSam system protein A [Clostridiales bacterium]|nr:AmmeMemoRadiSam system protein A [Clostridiales bacterium]